MAGVVPAIDVFTPEPPKDVDARGDKRGLTLRAFRLDRIPV